MPSFPECVAPCWRGLSACCSAAALLASCSALKLAYNNLPEVELLVARRLRRLRRRADAAGARRAAAAAGLAPAQRAARSLPTCCSRPSPWRRARSRRRRPATCSTRFAGALAGGGANAARRPAPNWRCSLSEAQLRQIERKYAEDQRRPTAEDWLDAQPGPAAREALRPVPRSQRGLLRSARRRPARAADASRWNVRPSIRWRSTPTASGASRTCWPCCAGSRRSSCRRARRRRRIHGLRAPSGRAAARPRRGAAGRR